MKKYIDFIGSASLCCFIVPMWLFESNYPQLGLADTLLIVAIFLGVFACIAISLSFIFKNLSKVSFLMSWIGVVFWFSHPLAAYSRKFIPNFIANSGYHWSLLYVCCLIAIVCLFFVAKCLPSFVKGTNKFLSVFTLSTSVMLLVEGCWKIFSNSKNVTSADSTRGVLNEKRYPNVYHILLDAHPNQKAMEIIGGDLKPFYRKLENLGFITFPESRSNYAYTSLSVASMLDMDYLPKDFSSTDVDNKRRNSKVFNEFKQHGYRIIFNTDTRVVRGLYGKFEEETYMPSGLLVQLYSLLVYTPIKHIYENIFQEIFRSTCIAGIKGAFQHLSRYKDIYGSSNNVFYTHILCPHEPCIFAKQPKNMAFKGFMCKFDLSHLSDKKAHRSFCENVYGIDVFVLECIKEILQQYKTETIQPIIVLHSDHSILGGLVEDLQNPFATPDTIYGNLLALHIPEAWKKDAKDLIFINLYRWIFNHLFEDKIYSFLK